MTDAPPKTRKRHPLMLLLAIESKDGFPLPPACVRILATSRDANRFVREIAAHPDAHVLEVAVR